MIQGFSVPYVVNTLLTAQKTATTSAAEVFAASARLAKRHTLVIRNVGTVDQVIYVGLAGVAANTGFRLYSKESKTIPLVPGLAIYVIAGENVAYDVEEYA